MKRLVLGAALALAGSAALASDLPPPRQTYTPPPVTPISPYTPVSVYNWTGVFVGGHFGGIWVNDKATVISAFSHTPGGVLLGVQVGFNYQSSNFVFGAGADMAWSSAKRTSTVGTATATTDVDYLGTLFLRGGYAWDNWLWYLKAGVAWMAVKYATTTVSVSDTRFGWLLGTGIEWGFWHNWSGFLEYNYLDFGSRTYTALATGERIKSQAHLITLGANYRFSSPVWSRY
jgi:outer membrane immunogenic protein